MLSVGADEERGLEKKRVSLGVPKVFELKKEKKRKLILSDSESEEDAMSPCRKDAPVAGQNGSGSLLEKRNDLERARCKEELKDKVRSLDTNKEKLKELESDKDELKFEEKMSLSSDAGKQRREDGTAESGTDNKVVKELGSDKEELKFDKEMSSSSDVPKQRDESGTDKNLAKELGSNKEDLKIEKKMSLSSDVAKQRDSSSTAESVTDKNLVKELGSDKEDLKFDKMSLSSNVAKQRDASGTAESVADKNLVKELGSDKEELKFDEKMSLSSDVAKQSEESGAAESGTNKNLVKELGSDKEELKFDKEMSLSSVKQIEEGGTDEKQAVELGSHKGELQFDKMAASSDAVIQRDKDGTNESKVIERSDKEELKFDKNKAMKSEAVKQTEEVAELGSPNGLKYVRKWATRLDMIKEWEEAGTKKKKSTELRSAKWELKFDKKAMSADFFKKREEAAEFRSHKGLKYDKKRALRLDTIRQWDEDTDKKKFTKLEHRFDKKKAMSSDEEEPIFEKKRSLNSAAVKRRGEGGTDKKKATERSDKDELRLNKNKCMKSDVIKQREVEFDKKRAMKSDIMKSDDKKKAAELGSEKEELKVYKKKAMGSDVVKQRQESGTDKKRVAELGSESKTDRKWSTETPDAGNSRKKIKTESSKDGQDQTKEIDEKKIHKLKDSSTRSVGVKGGEPEKVLIRREGEEQMKTSTPFIIANQKVAKHPSLSGGKQVLEKPSSIGSSDKRQLNTKRISSGEKHKSHEENSESESEITLTDKYKSLKRKTDLKSSSKKTEVEVVRPSSVKPDALVKGESVSSSKKSLLSTKQNTENGGENRATVVRKLREQIKGILLSAGWKIDLRPRRGRDYEDQVYVPPTGGGGYWSITKAYDVFQGQSGCASDDKSKKSSKLSTGSSSSSVIPTAALNMLKRKVVNKRRRVEDDETLGSRSKKLKGATKMKGLKNKRKESTGGVSGRKKTNSLAGSNVKGIDGSTAQNLRRVSGKSKKSQRGCALLVRDANQEADAEFDDYVPYIWKRTVLSWMIDLGVVPSNGKVKYMNKKQTHTMLEGRITRDGIHCSCCSKVLTVSKFEIHAGSKLHQPYENIFVQESGLSLLQCQLNAWEKQGSERQVFYNIEAEGEDPNDDTCGICGDGGDLMCCDGCPSTFHQSCLGFEVLPPGDWHCAYCTCRYCRVVSENSAQGNGVAVSPLLSCLQCEGKYHQECIPEADALSISSDKLHASFCGRSCKKIFRRLQKLLGAKNDLEAGFSWRLIRRLDKDTPRSPYALPQRAECNANVAVALAVMDECFLPIIDSRTGINLIHNVVNNCGSNINRLNYNGFYTFILERGDEIIAAASVRIHGTRLAEMPFIGTRNMYRRQGMCRRLLNGVESALCSLGVEKLIIPAISELKQTWTTVFGFKPLEFSQKQEVESLNMLVFHSTGLLQKPLLENHSAEQQHLATDEADKVEPEIKHHDLLKVAAESSAVSSVSPDHACDVAIVHSKHEEYKPPENADSEAVCHEEPVEGDKFKDCSLIVPRIKSPCKGTVHNHHAIENEAKCVSPAATSSTLQDADAVHRCRSDVTSTSSSSFPADHSIQASGECIVDGNCDMKDQITTLQPTLNALCDNSGPLNVDSDSAIVSSSGIKSCEISGVSPDDLTVGDEDISDVPVEPNHACSVVASDTGISKDELPVVKPAHAFGPSSLCASEVATNSVENGSSTNGSADASIL